MQKLSSKSRWVVVGLGVIGLALVALLLRGGPAPRRAAGAPALSRVEPAFETTHGEAVPRAPIALKTAPARKAGPYIERIDVDKTEVCAGEENFATVRAFDASGASDRLIVRLSGSREMGFRLPFRIEKSDANRKRHVFVTGGGGPPAIAAIPDVKLKDCEVAEQVSIGVRLEPRSPHVLTLSADVSSHAADAAAKFEPVSYEWDFGDGSKQTTDRAEVEHSYEGRPEKQRFSYFLLRVTAKDRRGREVTGSRAYGFTNFGFGAFVDEHRILVHAGGGSMPGARAADERIRLYHGYEGVVRLERVRSVELDATGDREISSNEFTPQALLGISELRPGASTTTRDLSALRPTEPGRVRKLEVYGRAGSTEAHGTIVLTTTAEITPPGASVTAESATSDGPSRDAPHPG